MSIITHALAFIVGGSVGIVAMAVCSAGRDEDRDFMRLIAERDALADDLLTCNREREQYRKSFGEAISKANEIVNLQP